MQRLNAVLDGVNRTLRARIQPGSPLWGTARWVKRNFDRVRYRNPVSRLRWRANSADFEHALDARQRAVDDFWFIQVGACDGVTDDLIRERVKRHRWRGILIEPQRHEFERLKQNYAAEADRLIFENVAVADQRGERVLYKVSHDRIQADMQRGLASFFPLKGIHDPAMIATEIVRCATFDDILNRHAIQRVDLLQIDVEGYDYEVLKLANLDRFKPRLIRYEHKHLSFQDAADCRAYLRRNGYSILPMGYDTGAVLQDQLPARG